ncbi:hypothetical protein M5K25_013745 [Dendrobium thyrsiflorum]|uniref:Copper transport protein n=1 Tax=Dendrobium thyrsiflorum TaxID=117978 RepID=A0ABD0V107_DENTH
MDMDGGMGGMSPPPASPAMPSGGGMGHGSMAHMAFYWGERAQILFSGWPGDRGHHIYFLALFLVATSAAICECLSVLSRRLAPQPSAPATLRSTFGLALTVIHMLKMGLLYLVMLAVMSFNVGVFIAAIAGHAVGFLIAGSGAFKWARGGGPQAEVATSLRPVEKI